MLDTRALSLLTPDRPNLGARIAARLWTVWAIYGDWRARRATVEILRGLDDRTLKDIGLDRDEIESAVFGNPGERLVRYQRDWRWRLF